MQDYTTRHFLMLQGPHGPFFSQLGKMLAATGSQVSAIGFNRGDQAFWHIAGCYVPYRGKEEDWAEWFSRFISDQHITDIVLYGDTRPLHAHAISVAKEAGLTVHIFEEGYLRPYWITYERGGSNGFSRLMDMSIADMRTALEQSEIEFPAAPARWGDMRQHIFYGALYHLFVMLGNRGYANYVPHRGISVFAEFKLYLHRLLLMPKHSLERRLASAKIKYGGFPYHLVLLQLEHDASFRMHSDFSSQTEFIEMVLSTFAKAAPRHHHIVFKAHPLEDGRAPVADTIARATKAFGLEGRVHFVRGGKLARMLAQTRTTVTVNSTAAQQALWRGIPVKTFGRTVYNKPEFVSDQSLEDFFASAKRPDRRAYRDYRHYLLETSQVAGGFYSARARRAVMRQVVDMMLSPEDPYDALASGNAAPRQQLSDQR